MEKEEIREGGYSEVKRRECERGPLNIKLKGVKALEPIHEPQLLTYMKLTGCMIGLLINFNVPVLRQGIKRMVRI